jgi:hypothetical protein
MISGGSGKLPNGTLALLFVHHYTPATITGDPAACSLCDVRRGAQACATARPSMLQGAEVAQAFAILPFSIPIALHVPRVTHQVLS